MIRSDPTAEPPLRPRLRRGHVARAGGMLAVIPARLWSARGCGDDWRPGGPRSLTAPGTAERGRPRRIAIASRPAAKAQPPIAGSASVGVPTWRITAKRTAPPARWRRHVRRWHPPYSATAYAMDTLGFPRGLGRQPSVPFWPTLTAGPLIAHVNESGGASAGSEASRHTFPSGITPGPCTSASAAWRARRLPCSRVVPDAEEAA